MNLLGSKFSLPSKPLLLKQAEWLVPARSQLLRKIGIARRRTVLDLAAGYGSVSGELSRRCGGSVFALDHEVESLREIKLIEYLFRIGGDATALPFADKTFDLVFCQCALLWVKPIKLAINEIWRVLQLNGTLLAIEPDYGALIEYPEEIATRQLWLNALYRSGADPFIGRQLPGLLEQQGFRVQVDLLGRLQPPSLSRFDFLRDLPLTPDERILLTAVETSAASLNNWQQIVHLPFFLIIADKRSLR